MIQLTKDGLSGSLSTDDLASQFAEFHTFRLPALLHHDLLQLLTPRLQQSDWQTQDDGKIAREAAPNDPALQHILNFAANTSDFLALIREITGCDQISHFGGRVYKMDTRADHFDSWHGDIGSTKDRLVGMSINLSPRPYSGGVFVLRNETSGEVVSRLENTGPGDAIFFRIDPGLKHMVTQLHGIEPKIAFAGWFRSGEINFYSELSHTTEANPAE